MRAAARRAIVDYQIAAPSAATAVRTAAGWKKVVEWLKYLENGSARHGDGPIPDYDYGWMWEDLELAELRK